MPKQNNCNANKSTTSTKTSAKEKNLQTQSAKKALALAKHKKNTYKHKEKQRKNQNMQVHTKKSPSIPKNNKSRIRTMECEEWLFSFVFMCESTNNSMIKRWGDILPFALWCEC